jgi:HlyD family secretion protein
LIELDQPNHSTLRANRRVDVELVTERKSDVLIARRGPAVSGSGATELFAVSGDAALRRKVQVGLVNLDWFEVISGAEAGEQLIVSDMRTWDGHNTLALR